MQQIQSLHQLHYQPLKRQDLVSLGRVISGSVVY